MMYCLMCEGAIKLDVQLELETVVKEDGFPDYMGEEIKSVEVSSATCSFCSANYEINDDNDPVCPAVWEKDGKYVKVQDTPTETVFASQHHNKFAVTATKESGYIALEISCPDFGAAAKLTTKLKASNIKKMINVSLLTLSELRKRPQQDRLVALLEDAIAEIERKLS